MPPVEVYWQGPFLVWLGDGDPPDACPEQAPLTKFQGVAPPPAPPPCTCDCAPPTGSCTVPSAITANAGPCSNAGSGTPFDLPAAWDGSCTAPGSLGGAVESATVAPLTVKDKCEPVTAEQVQDVPASPGAVLACDVKQETAGPCAGNSICAPAAPAAPASAPWGWTHCILPKDPVPPPTTCPPFYPEMYTFALQWHDTRGCSLCTCDPPTGSGCTSHVALYSNAMCSGTDTVAVDASSAQPVCVDVLPSDPILGVEAETPVYTPGTCAHSGGTPTGTLTPAMPVTFCCLEDRHAREQGGGLHSSL